MWLARLFAQDYPQYTAGIIDLMSLSKKWTNNIELPAYNFVLGLEKAGRDLPKRESEGSEF